MDVSQDNVNYNRKKVKNVQKVFRQICIPVFDISKENRQRHNKKLQELMDIEPVTSFIKGLRFYII